MKINTGTSYLPLKVVLGIWSVSALTALPGLAISPIMGDLQTIFPKAGEEQIQMLTSIPSLLILPFIILSGYLTQKVNIYKLLIAGLVIFGVTGLLYMLSSKMWQMLLVSALLGIGAGIIIPLSTGIITLFFSGKAKTNQFGLNSSISNLTVVVATFLTGYLASIHWRLAFIVYLLPFISLILVIPLRKYWKQALRAVQVSPGGQNGVRISSHIGKYGLDIKHLGQVMALYGIVTLIVVTIIFYLPFLFEAYHISGILGGSVISIFFLAIMLPGFFLNKIIDKLNDKTIPAALILIAGGLILICFTRNEVLLFLSAIAMGLGYGVIQPVSYDKTTYVSAPAKNTEALAYVMIMNYLAIVLCPVIFDAFKTIFHIKSNVSAFVVSAIIAVGLVIVAMLGKKNFVFDVKKSL